MQYRTIQDTAFFGLLIIATVTFGYLLLPMLQPLVWAVILGIVFYPWYRRIAAVLPNPSLASAATILLLLLILFTPLYILLSLVAKEALVFYQNTVINDTAFIQNVGNALSLAASELGFSLDPTSVQDKLAGLVETIATTITALALSLGKATTQFVVLFLLMLYILFFVFRDGETFLKRLQHLLPLGSEKERELFSRFSDIVRAIFKGTLAIAFLQGVLGGVILAISGVPNSVLWGAVMVVLAIIPALGPALVLVPFAIWAFLQGAIIPAVIMAVGVGIVSVTDNLLRPILVGKQTHMHDLLIMLSLLGGLALWGVSGFVLGPVLAGLTITLWEMFEARYHKQLSDD